MLEGSRIIVRTITICFLAFFLFTNSSAAKSSLSTGIGATKCFDVIAWQHHRTAKREITGWATNFIKEVNQTVSKNQLNDALPNIAMDPDLLWFAILAYCGLDLKKPLVEAVMDLVHSEWDKLTEWR